MKKKVKDLTREEFEKICGKYDDSCNGCPFNHLESCEDLKDYLSYQDILKTLEQEIEVNYDE